MLSTTSSEVVVLGACCRMSFHLGRPSTTTSGLGASMVPGRGCTLEGPRVLPPQAEVLTSTSRTLDAIGLTEEIDQSQDYRPVRPRLMQLNYQTQADEMRKIGASPNYVVGSVHAVTEQGQILVASASGSQLGLYASGSDTVIWVVGAQKIVPDLEEGFRRI